MKGHSSLVLDLISCVSLLIISAQAGDDMKVLKIDKTVILAKLFRAVDPDRSTAINNVPSLSGNLEEKNDNTVTYVMGICCE